MNRSCNRTMWTALNARFISQIRSSVFGSSGFAVDKWSSLISKLRENLDGRNFDLLKKTNSIQWVMRSEWSIQSRCSGYYTRSIHIHSAVKLDDQTLGLTKFLPGWVPGSEHTKQAECSGDSLTLTIHRVDFDWRIYIKYQCFVFSCGVCWPTYMYNRK